MNIANLAAALVKAQACAEAVAKSSINSFHRYKFASAEALIEEGRSALSSNGLALMTSSWDVVPSPIEGITSRVVVHYLLVHSSGESLELHAETSVLPEKGRPQDKAEATALTYNLGYFIRGLLLLPREEEGAVDARDDRHREQRPIANTRPEPREAPPPVQAPAANALSRIEAVKSVEELNALWKELSAGQTATYVDGMKPFFAKRRDALQKAEKARIAELAKEAS